MACEQSKPATYEVYEYDAGGIAHKTEKIVEFDLGKLGAYGHSELIVLSFFKQIFDTINTTSGFTALFEGPTVATDLITIRWRTPHWKLVRVK